MDEMWTRRAALLALGAAGLASAFRTSVCAGAAAPAARVELTVHPGEAIAAVPANYTGLSYESAQLVHAGFFSPGNKELVALVRTLGRRGVLRIGGNTSAFTAWGTGQPTAALKDNLGYGPDLGAKVQKQTPGMYVLTPLAIDNLHGFLQATGWGLIYGLNLRHGTPEKAADEAAYVAKTCGDALLALQFGNEPDLFNHESGSEAPGTRWSYDEFLGAWEAMYKAVHARVPHVPIAGPDCAFNAEWVGRFARDTKGEVSLLTTHYYAEGPPTDPKMTIGYLLHPGEKLQKDVYDAMAAAKQAGLPFRLTEGNSCYNGGKRGVSNTFASALWAGTLCWTWPRAGPRASTCTAGARACTRRLPLDLMGDRPRVPISTGCGLRGSSRAAGCCGRSSAGCRGARM